MISSEQPAMDDERRGGTLLRDYESQKMNTGSDVMISWGHCVTEPVFLSKMCTPIIIRCMPILISKITPCFIK